MYIAYCFHLDKTLLLYQDMKAISMQEVKEEVRAIKNRKAAGLDKITGEIIKKRDNGCVIIGCGDCVIGHLKMNSV